MPLDNKTSDALSRLAATLGQSANPSTESFTRCYQKKHPRSIAVINYKGAVGSRSDLCAAMTDQPPIASAADKRPAKPKRPKKPSVARGALPLVTFRRFLEVVQSHRAALNDDRLRAFEKLLHAFANDADGTVKFGLVAAGEALTPKRPRYSNAVIAEPNLPGDDDIRTQTREIALIDDDAERHRRIDALGERFLRRAAEIFAFRAETISGFRSGIAAAVADVRQMEQIAASGQRRVPTETKLGGSSETAISPASDGEANSHPESM